MQFLVELYSAASIIRLAFGKLNTHKVAPLYEPFSPEQAGALVQRPVNPLPPKHGSWRNVAELEFAVFAKVCLGRQFPDEATLKFELAVNIAERNTHAHRVQRQITKVMLGTSCIACIDQ